jgi:hypothetical protein
MNKPEEVGYIVIFHFDPPFKHAKHCLDWTRDVNARIRDHYKRTTRGPRVLHAALEGGSKLKVGKVRAGTKSQMLALRKSGNSTKLCKLCKQERVMKFQEDHLLELLEASVELHVCPYLYRDGRRCQFKKGHSDHVEDAGSDGVGFQYVSVGGGGGQSESED